MMKLNLIFRISDSFEYFPRQQQKMIMIDKPSMINNLKEKFEFEEKGKLTFVVVLVVSSLSLEKSDFICKKKRKKN